MYDMFDYLEWRGDIPFEKMGPNPVDMLIFATLSYIQFDGIVPETTDSRIPLKEAAERFLSQGNLDNKIRVKKDLELLGAAAGTERFGMVEMSFYRSVFDREKETQFAAVTYYPGDGSAVLTYRGTDRTLVGWKEDFNMAFQDSIPAQREAFRYLTEFACDRFHPIRMCGHSKGGNLAVYAAAKADEILQQRIQDIYNLDGPGFSERMMSDAGYLSIVPKISTYIPESSIVGILLEREEPYMVIKSKQIGPMQHDPYSWEVVRNDFIYKEEISGGARFVDEKTKVWLESMTVKERNTLVDMVYEILTTGGAVKTDDLASPKWIGNYVKALVKEEVKRQTIVDHISGLVRENMEKQENK